MRAEGIGKEFGAIPVHGGIDVARKTPVGEHLKGRIPRRGVGECGHAIFAKFIHFGECFSTAQRLARISTGIATVFAAIGNLRTPFAYSFAFAGVVIRGAGDDLCAWSKLIRAPSSFEDAPSDGR